MQLASDSKITPVHLPALCSAIPPCSWMSIVLQGKSCFKCWRLQLACKQRFLCHHEPASQTAQIPYSLLMRLLCLLSSQKCQSNAPKTGRHSHSCLLASPSHGSHGECQVEGRTMRASMVNGECWEWHLALDFPAADWHFSLIYFVILPFPSWSRNLIWFHQQMSVWFYWGPGIQSMPWLLSSVTKYSENINLSQSPTSKSCPGSWQQKSNDLISTKHGVAMEGAFLVRKISSFMSVNES